MSRLRIADELREHSSLSNEQVDEAAEIARNLVVRILDAAADQAGRRIADNNFASFIEPQSYAKGYFEAMNYLDAALSGGRDFQSRADWQERMAKLSGEGIENGDGRDSGDDHLRGDRDPDASRSTDVGVDDDEPWDEDDDIEWED